METVFEIVPAGMKPFYLLLPIFVLFLGALPLA
jgi:hypothetical protein